MKKNIMALCGVSLLFLSVGAEAADWYQSYDSDEMRGTSTRFIQTRSDNSVDFSFPYNGGARMSIILRSKKTQLKAGQQPSSLKPAEVLLVMDKGQFICSSYDDCSVSVKFDSGKVLQYSVSKSADADSKVFFIDNAQSFIKNISTHKSLIIEADFFQEGSKQFKFDLSGYSTPKE